MTFFLPCHKYLGFVTGCPRRRNCFSYGVLTCFLRRCLFKDCSEDSKLEAVGALVHLEVENPTCLKVLQEEKLQSFFWILEVACSFSSKVNTFFIAKLISNSRDDIFLMLSLYNRSSN